MPVSSVHGGERACLSGTPGCSKGSFGRCVMTRSRAEIGKANSRKGKTVERAVVTWLRDNGFPHAERAVRTGYSNGDAYGADPGDITGTPGLVWQVTDRADIEQDAVLRRRLVDAERQRAEASAEFGFLVVKRRRCADPGRWWVFMDAQYLHGLLHEGYNLGEPWSAVERFPVRASLGAVVPVLRARGYGEPLEEKA